jgi:hypothetical protein
VKSAEARRSLDEIADDIVSALESLKHDFDKTRAGILAVLKNLQEMVPLKKTGAASVIKKRAKRALDALVALEEVYPYIHVGNSETLWVWNMVELLAHLKSAPDPRTDVSQLMYAYMAGSLVEQYSKREPVMTEAKRGGNVHAIAQWLFEAATGEQIAKNKPSGLLGAVQKVHRWPVNATAPK